MTIKMFFSNIIDNPAVYDTLSRFLVFGTLVFLAALVRNYHDDKVHLKGGKLTTSVLLVTLLYTIIARLSDNIYVSTVLYISSAISGLTIPETIKSWRSKKVRKMYDVISKGPKSLLKNYKDTDDKE